LRSKERKKERKSVREYERNMLDYCVFICLFRVDFSRVVCEKVESIFFDFATDVSPTNGTNPRPFSSSLRIFAHFWDFTLFLDLERDY